MQTLSSERLLSCVVGSHGHVAAVPAQLIDIYVTTCVMLSIELVVHCADIQHRVEQALGGALDSRMCIHEVRLVAPNKKMLCLTFCIPPDVAFATLPEVLKVHAADELNAGGDSAEQLTKRQRTLL